MNERRGLQERLEASRGGRLAISAVLIWSLFCIAVTNLPEAYLRNEVSNVTQRYLNLVGLNQFWGVFAPDPRREVVKLEARSTYANGQTGTWRPPERDPFIGAYSDYRWRKYVEQITARGSRDVYTQLARWVAREQRQGDQPPTQVTLVKRSAALPPPGKGAARDQPLANVEFFSLTPFGGPPPGAGP